MLIARLKYFYLLSPGNCETASDHKKTKCSIKTDRIPVVYSAVPKGMVSHLNVKVYLLFMHCM